MDESVKEDLISGISVILVVAIILIPLLLCDKLGPEQQSEVTLIEGTMVHIDNNTVYIAIGVEGNTVMYKMHTRDLRLYDNIRATCIDDSITAYKVLEEM